MEEPSHILRYPTGEAIEQLAARFGLPTGPDMQDWEWEVADSNRIDEFLAAYETGGLSDDERFTLMEMILESFEEIGREGIDLCADARWRRTMEALERNISLHAHSVWCWSCLEAEGPEEMFHISRFIRQIMAAHRSLFTEPDAPPIGGPAERLGDSEAGGGPAS